MSMNVNSVGIRKNLKIDTSILPVKYQANTTDQNPVEVMRFNLNSSSSSLVEVKARAGNIGGGTDRASFVFTQRIRRGNTGVASVDERDDDHTFRTNSEMQVYIEALNPSEIFSSWENAIDLGPSHLRAFLVDPLPEPYMVVMASKSVFDPNYATTFLTETDIVNYLNSNPSPVHAYGAQYTANTGETSVYYNQLAFGNDARVSAFIIDLATETIVKKIGDTVAVGGVATFYPSDNFVSSGPNHALFVKGLNATNLLWTLTVGQV